VGRVIFDDPSSGQFLSTNDLEKNLGIKSPDMISKINLGASSATSINNQFRRIPQSKGELAS